ncbi:MAG: pitrilysin family protein [bacterium]
MQFQTSYTKLKNGVRVLTVPIKGAESVTALVLVKTGSRNESDKQAGISHVLEHMLFKGTKRYPTALLLAEAVDAMGALNNAFTGKEYTGYYITASGKHLPKSLDILGEMVTSPLLPGEDLKREREVIVEEINMYEDHPMERAGEEFENLIYGGSRMGKLIIGTKESVRATETKDLRTYMKKWYGGGNVLVVMAGKVKNISEGIVEQNFGGLQKGTKLDYLESAGYGKEKDFHLKKKTEQAHFVIGVPGLSMLDPRRYALQVAEVVLGGNMSSRLFNEIREKRGLAYYVGAEIETNYDVGYLAVKAGVKLEKLTEAMAVVKQEMLELGETITEKEVASGKDYLLGKLPLSLEGSMEVARFLGMRALITSEIRQPEEVKEQIKKVTKAEVQKVLRELMSDEKLRSVVVGPKGK